MRKNNFENAMALLVETFPDKQMNLTIMWEFLKDLDDKPFLESIKTIINTKNDINRATNMIALIREHAIPEPLTAGEAWAEVIHQISNYGRNGSPEFSSPIIAQAVSCIGWKSICMSENISVERAHFLKTFECLSKRQRIQDLGHNQENRLLNGSTTKGIENDR